MRWIQEAFQVSMRRACHATGVWRSGILYQSRRPSQEPLRRRLRELASVRVSYGQKRLHVLLRREGWAINHKRTRRLYREEGLQLGRRRGPKRRKHVSTRPVRAPVERPNMRWAMDFVHDQTATGATFRVLTVIDVYSRECLALVARPRFRGADVAAALTTLLTQRGRPAVLQCDQGTEFTSMAMDAWAYWQHIPLDLSRRGTPGDNAVNEAFNGSLRRECLSQHHFYSIEDAQQILDAWQAEYNNERPHSSLHDLAPAHFRAQATFTPEPIAQSS
jgi:putative transposase